MSTLQQCLEQLPDDLRMLALPEPGRTVFSVAEMKVKYQRIEHGFEVRDEKYEYGQRTRKVIGIIGGLTIFRQVDE